MEKKDFILFHIIFLSLLLISVYGIEDKKTLNLDPESQLPDPNDPNLLIFYIFLLFIQMIYMVPSTQKKFYFQVVKPIK